MGKEGGIWALGRVERRHSQSEKGATHSEILIIRETSNWSPMERRRRSSSNSSVDILKLNLRVWEVHSLDQAITLGYLFVSP